MAVSEFVRMKQRIEEECQALHRAMYESAVVASHEVINNRYRRLGTYQDQLEKLVGEKKAMAVVVEAYDRIV